MAFSRDFSDVGISSSDTILNRWSHVSMPCIFIGCLIKPSSARFSRWPHTLRNLSREAKNIKHVWFYPHGLARRISHYNFPAHVRKRLSKPPCEPVFSALSSSVRRALTIGAAGVQFSSDLSFSALIKLKAPSCVKSLTCVYVTGLHLHVVGLF